MWRWSIADRVGEGNAKGHVVPMQRFFRSSRGCDVHFACLPTAVRRVLESSRRYRGCIAFPTQRG